MKKNEFVTILGASILAATLFTGCNSGASCCGGPVSDANKAGSQPVENNSISIGNSGSVAGSNPSSQLPTAVSSLAPSATIIVNDEDKEQIKQGCKPLHLEAQSNDPDGNNDNITYAWLLDNVQVSDKAKFCYKVEGLGEHNMTLTVTDETNTSASDMLTVIVE